MEPHFFPSKEIEYEWLGRAVNKNLIHLCSHNECEICSKSAVTKLTKVLVSVSLFNTLNFSLEVTLASCVMETRQNINLLFKLIFSLFLLLFSFVYSNCVEQFNKQLTNFTLTNFYSIFIIEK